jgi:hypothetical protein
MRRVVLLHYLGDMELFERSPITVVSENLKKCHCRVVFQAPGGFSRVFSKNKTFLFNSVYVLTLINNLKAVWLSIFMKY